MCIDSVYLMFVYKDFYQLPGVRRAFSVIRGLSGVDLVSTAYFPHNIYIYVRWCTCFNGEI